MNRRSPRSIALACLFGSALIGAGPALAADIPKETDLRLPPAADGEPRFPALKGTFTLQWENDIIADTDRNYTNGIRLAWLSPENEMPDWLVPMYRHLPLLDDDGIPWIGFSLGQSLFTPEDIGARTLIEDDRPYAAWLYGGLGFLSDTGDHLDTFEIDFGVIGPPAMGEPTQNLVHDVINAQKANGWDNQLNFEPGMVVYFERKWRAIWDNAPLGLQADVVPHVGLAAGNIHTYGATGLTFRLGDDLRGDYGAPRIRPSLPGTDFFVQRDGFGWYFFAGVEGRAVARNIFLDGNTFGNSHSVDKRYFAGDLQGGLAVILGAARLTFTHVYRTAEFEGDTPDRFAGLSMSVQF
ncbi:MAG: lipid A deacylase LpxR family protein [Proteobacteria bacterium]|nr:lipid A deacylase LpxR family protein [Pseudomonadota bacterium]